MQLRCDVGKHVDGHPVFASLQRTDVGAVQLRAMRKFLLRQAHCLTPRFHVPRKYFPNLHVEYRQHLAEQTATEYTLKYSLFSKSMRFVGHLSLQLLHAHLIS